MTILFRCGHSVVCERTVEKPPACQQCGERVVVRVLHATPTFKGACKGPLVVTT